ncbi:MAG: Crp/Fnr family transcriptional regulator [candidate division Zixibacteria bacterium]|nr:Crp/Fnr family transcriptional regulator [candidate division Zixibacteria bacterium]
MPSNSAHLITHLQRCVLFSDLPESLIVQLASASALKQAARDEILFSDGEPAHSFFVVGTGRVKVFKMSPDGKEQILLIANPGDTFAEAAMFSGGNFPASAQALADSELVTISREKFIALVHKSPDLALSIIAHFAELLRKLTRLVEEISLSDVTSRLAHHLCSFVDPKTGRLKTKITLAEKKTTLASQLGTIPETLSRSLAKLTREGVIKVDGRTIEILDPDRLAQIAGVE